MVLECELKYLDININELSGRLAEVGAWNMGRYFESNLVFDYPDRSLKGASILLRLRERQGQAVLTVKRPPGVSVSSALKVFEEIETTVGDFSVMQAALEAVGFSVAFAYEKVREKWKYKECTICLDHLPFGDYVEIEGTEETVRVCAEAVGLDACKTSKATYHALNIEHRSVNGLDQNESFVFDDERRAVLFKEIGKE
ncbi:MAG: class IV adenylate cyclase [Pseudodesulfovibrio sp.]|nr:class IV adenylate cyclase [Pseudodesulfovibrio sp.]